MSPSQHESPFIPFPIVHESVALQASVAMPEGTGPWPAVLMIPGATGPGPSFEAAMRELADLGFLTFGIDMYGVEADISTTEAAGAHFVALLATPEILRDRVVAWFEAIRARADVQGGHVGAIGYCFGGKCVLELARSGAGVRCVSSFHALLETHAPAQPGVVSAKVAVWTGGRDPFAPVAQADALRAEFDAAGVDYQMTLFGQAQHSFTDPDHDGLMPGIAYDRVSHRVAWAGTLALLDACLR